MDCGWFCRGIKEDFVARIRWYADDWTDWLSLKVLSSTFFIFFTSLGPAITFALFLGSATDGEIGAVEVLAATALTGILFAIFAGQPLVIVGVTGPVSILTASIYILSEQWGIDFLPFYAWSQIWAAAMLMLLACVNACDLLKYVTRFSCEIFGILIALIYIYTGIDGIVKVLGNLRIEFASGLIQFIIAVGTVYMSNVLSHARTWTVGNEALRDLISDYGPTIALILWSVVPVLTEPRLEDTIPKLFVPLSFSTTTGRGWFVNLADIPGWGIVAAIFPGLIIVVLFIFDHNVSSLLAQETDMKLKKGSAFHLDFFVLGLGVFLTGILGIPPTNGLISQAPLHTKSLIVKKRIFIDGTPTDKFEVEKVYEQRVSNLAQSFLIGLVCFRPFSDALREIPNAVLYGLFLFLGISSFEDNEFSYRMNLLVMEPNLRKCSPHPYDFVAALDFAVIQKYTFVQMVLCSIIFVITFTPAGVIFPVLIAMLIGIRLYALPRIFTAEELDALDSHIINETADSDGSQGDDSIAGSAGSAGSAAADFTDSTEQQRQAHQQHRPSSSQRHHHFKLDARDEEDKMAHIADMELVPSTTVTSASSGHSNRHNLHLADSGDLEAHHHDLVLGEVDYSPRAADDAVAENSAAACEGTSNSNTDGGSRGTTVKSEV